MNYGEGGYREYKKTALNSKNSVGLSCCKLMSLAYPLARVRPGKSLSNINGDLTKFKVLNLVKNRLKQG
jgi:hypothetical protein